MRMSWMNPWAFCPLLISAVGILLTTEVQSIFLSKLSPPSYILSLLSRWDILSQWLDCCHVNTLSHLIIEILCFKVGQLARQQARDQHHQSISNITDTDSGQYCQLLSLSLSPSYGKERGNKN